MNAFQAAFNGRLSGVDPSRASACLHGRLADVRTSHHARARIMREERRVSRLI